MRAAYSATGEAWETGPSRIYDRLAEVLVARCPGGVSGRRVLDLGAGTGAATRAALAAGAAEVVASDLAVGMLAVAAARRPPACVSDALALPFADGTFDAVVAAYSLNHLADPVIGLLEAARVLAPGGALAVSAYAEDDVHPVKAAVDAVLAARGWEAAPWYLAVKADAVPRLATVERAAAAMAAAGFAGAEVANDRVEFPDLTAADLVDWRLGMAHVADYANGLSLADRAEISTEAVERLGPEPPLLVRSVINMTWQKD
jgi:ubiquinone/menaquinone biosynthesis C-methylase UbiE